MLEKNKSIQQKIMSVNLLTSTIVLLITFASYFIYEIFSYRQISLAQLSVLGEMVATNSTAALAFDNVADADEILLALKADKNIESACLYDSKGNVFSIYPNTLHPSTFTTLSLVEGYRVEGNYFIGIQSVTEGETHFGTLYIKKSMTSVYNRLILYTLIAGAILLVCIVIAFLLSLRLQRRITSPLISLAQTSRIISETHNYTIRAHKQSEDEIGLLTDAFNNMLSQIEKQNAQIELGREAAQNLAAELEVKVNERTIEYKKQKDFAESILNSSLVMIAVFDTNTRIISYNKKCEEELGYKREEVIGRKWSEAMPGIVNSPSYSDLQRAIKGETIHNPEYKSSITNEYFESYMVPLYNEKNNVYAVLMTAHIITGSVESRERLNKMNNELRQKNLELEQFAYVASHDLQEPLRKIRTFISLVKNSTTFSDSIDKYLTKIQTSAERMSALIKDVLEYSRLSQVHDTFVEIDLNLILEYVKSDFELLLAERNAELLYQELPTLYGNKLQLHQLFANLISNAIKFCEVQPRITISWEWLPAHEISMHELNIMNNYYKITFTDNGIGFEQKYADRIFTIFQRLNTREKYEGTGIGLALCKRIVENHNGRITAKSEIGKGTTFVIILPATHDV